MNHEYGFRIRFIKGLHSKHSDKYRIAPEGAKELGICYFCNGKIRNGQAVLANIYGWGDYNFGVLCHPSCISNWFRSELGDEAGWSIDASIICDFCGLPLSLDILKRFTRAERHYVNYNELEKHLSTNEKKALKELKKDQVNFRRYEDIGQLVDKIVDESKKQKISLENYDPHQRKKELWNITQELLKTEDGWVYGRLWHSSERRFYSRLVKNALKKLVDPISIIYSVITEPSYAANSVKMYVGGDHSLAIVKDGMKYHPYCYKMMNELEIVSQRIENNESKRIRNI